MKSKYFWLLADGKTVREISWEQWRDIAQKEFDKDANTRLICRVDNSEVYLRKSRNFIWIPMVQLKEMLRVGVEG